MRTVVASLWISISEGDACLYITGTVFLQF